jgi:hypothetical protein
VRPETRMPGDGQVAAMPGTRCSAGLPGAGDARKPGLCGFAGSAGLPGSGGLMMARSRRCPEPGVLRGCPVPATPGNRCSAVLPGSAGLPGSGGLMMARLRRCPETGVLRVTCVGRCARLGGLRRGPDHQVTTVRGGRVDGLAPQVTRLAGCERLGVVHGRPGPRRNPSQGGLPHQLLP